MFKRNFLFCLLLLWTTVHANETSKPPLEKSRVVICGCARDVAEHLPRVFANGIYPIAKLFYDYRIVIFENDSQDETLNILSEMQIKDSKFILLTERGLDHQLKSRTKRLAYARNRYLEYVHTRFPHFDYLIVLDMDDHPVENREVQAEKIRLIFDMRERWDALSIGSPFYYDIWALRSKEYPHNCWNVNHPHEFVDRAKKEMRTKIKGMKKNELLEVDSSFNGITFYYLPKTTHCLYDGENKEPVVKTKRDCEHVAFHRDMKAKHDAKIMISPLKIF